MKRPIHTLLTGLAIIVPIANAQVAAAQSASSPMESSARNTITILGEEHTNSSALRESVNLAIQSPRGTIVAEEMPAIMNGVIQAYMDDKISKKDLTKVLDGYMFAAFASRAGAMADTFEKFKKMEIRLSLLMPEILCQP